MFSGLGQEPVVPVTTEASGESRRRDVVLKASVSTRKEKAATLLGFLCHSVLMLRRPWQGAKVEPVAGATQLHA